MQPASQRAAVAHPIMPVLVHAAHRRIQAATEPLRARAGASRSCASCCSRRCTAPAAIGSSGKELMDPANLSTAADAIPTAVEIAGDAAVGREVRGWFATGLAKAAAPDVALLASGTQSPELATTTAASLKLAAAWDALKLAPDRIHASLFGDGKLAFVTATVYLPRKTGPGAVRMSVAIVATRTGTGWRWVSLQFSA